VHGARRLTAWAREERVLLVRAVCAGWAGGGLRLCRWQLGLEGNREVENER